MGDQDLLYEDGDLPIPIKKLIASGGGGPSGNAAQMPLRKLIIDSDYTVRPYDRYLRLFTSNKYFGLRVNDKPIPESLYFQAAIPYLDLMGVPLYL